MTYWDILGISMTDNVAAIKQAYAQQTRLYHPEEYPQEFQRLRKAYSFAISYSRNSRHVYDINDHRLIPQESGEQPAARPRLISFIELDEYIRSQQAKRLELINGNLRKAENLYRKQPRSKNAWRDYFSRQEVLDLRSDKSFTTRFFRLIGDGGRFSGGVLRVIKPSLTSWSFFWENTDCEHFFSSFFFMCGRNFYCRLFSSEERRMLVYSVLTAVFVFCVYWGFSTFLPFR
ncbi:MAG: hypothetical protein LBC56_07405 [Oscillospiraceae bacterium]|jgi:curved DNA-binding protein CbpA|nr:hypothetical protein [Oscillospiraceae bacterium]